MPFNAIVHAPRLRTGARVSIAEADQCCETRPASIDAGAMLKMRFGVCCPDRADGTIIDYAPAPERAILAVGDKRWTIMKGASGVTTPGLVTEDWFVTDAAVEA